MNFGKTDFSESFPELWLFIIGALFIGVVMLFPNGLEGIDKDKVVDAVKKLSKRVPAAPPVDPVLPKP